MATETFGTSCSQQKIYSPLIVAQRVEACVMAHAEKALVETKAVVGSSGSAGGLEVGSLNQPESFATAGLFAEWPRAAPASTLWALSVPATALGSQVNAIGASFDGGLRQSPHSLRLKVWPLASTNVTADVRLVELRPVGAAAALFADAQLEVIPTASLAAFVATEAGRPRCLQPTAKVVRDGAGNPVVQVSVVWNGSFTADGTNPWLKDSITVWVHLLYVRKPAAPAAAT